MDTNRIRLDDRQADQLKLLLMQDLTVEQFEDLKNTLLAGDGIKMYHAIRKGKFHNAKHEPW